MLARRYKRSIEAFLYPPSRAAGRADVAFVLSKISSYVPGTAVFGGVLRDLALGGIRGFGSDIDLVTLHPHDELSAAIKEFQPRLNKFGGFRFCYGRWMFDVWSIDNTWAIKNGLVRGEGFKDLLNTTFFNIDQAAFDITSRRYVAAENYFRGIESRILDINLIDNPSPTAMARRAIRLALSRDLKISPELSKYIFCHADRSSDDPLIGAVLRDISEHLEISENVPFSFSFQRDLWKRRDDQ